MPHELPKAYDPALIEEKWAKFWADEHLFDVPTPPSGHAPKPFVQLLPPPNVTGRLHMGHMLNQTEMDILTRWHRMSGSTALWVPGTDHAGIATQMMVERQLAAEGKRREDFSRDEFTARVWAWKQQYGSAITEQMKRLGASVAWSREYFTMDDRLSVAVKQAFVRLWNQGLIYRGAYIVNWDPQLQTAVSDLEVESEERPGHLYHIRYHLADGPLPDGGALSPGAEASITIATTRPETMLGDTAVAVNPRDPRYQHLIGKLLTLPLSAAAGRPDRQIPILADDWANPEFGTGAVKVTPAHDPNDFAIGQRHSLPSPSIMDAQARIDLPGSPYDKLDRFEARKRIVADLEAAGHLVAVKDHVLTLPISQRTGAVIEPRLSLQWFLAVNKEIKVPDGKYGILTKKSIAEHAIAAVRDGHIRFTPEMYTKTYNEWMSNLHDWCISRQLWWGHRIPAWHCGACSQINVALEPPTTCSNCASTNLTQETDVLDTWFSSGLLPFTIFGWPGQVAASEVTASELTAQMKGRHSERSEEPPHSAERGNRPSSAQSTLTPDLAAFYPTSLLVTGFDILFFWVARMIMLGCHFMLDVPMPDGSPRTLADAVPFRQVYIHALVRDADRQKMSKTKGNVIDPIEVVTKYGTDAVRFTLASQASPGTDIAFNEARTEGYRAFANKIWNAARFLFMNLDRARHAGYSVSLSTTTELSSRPERSVVERPAVGTTTTAAPLETRWILSRLHTVSAEIAHSLAIYRFDEAANAIYQFFWGEFCDWYIELIKLRLTFDIPTPTPGAPSSPTLDPGAPSSPTPGPERAVSARLGGTVLSSAKVGPATTPDPTTALTLDALVTVFDAALRLLSPFMPFLTEELWHALYAALDQPTPAKSIALTRYPQLADFPADPSSVAAMSTLQDIIVAVRGLRKDLGVPEKEPAPIALHAGKDIQAIIAANPDMLSRLARVSSTNFVSCLPTGANARSNANFDVAVLYERQIDVPAERERLTRDLAKYTKGLEAANKQLSNEGFLARAPEAIVAGLRKQHAETLALKEKTEAALAALPPE